MRGRQKLNRSHESRSHVIEVDHSSIISYFVYSSKRFHTRVWHVLCLSQFQNLLHFKNVFVVFASSSSVVDSPLRRPPSSLWCRDYLISAPTHPLFSPPFFKRLAKLERRAKTFLWQGIYSTYHHVTIRVRMHLNLSTTHVNKSRWLVIPLK